MNSVLFSATTSSTTTSAFVLVPNLLLLLILSTCDKCSSGQIYDLVRNYYSRAQSVSQSVDVWSVIPTQKGRDHWTTK